MVEATIAGTLPPIPVPETNSAYIQPVAAEILDFFRPPAHIGGSGNRGWEYGTTSGTQIVAAADGQVHFAGKIGKSSYVSINHPDGLRTTYSHVADITVKKNQSVSKGQLLASTSEVAFHFGVRVDKNYLDPAEIFTTGTLEIFHLLVPATSNR